MSSPVLTPLELPKSGSKVLVPIPPQSEQQRIAKSMAEIQAIRKEALKASENVVHEMSLLLGQFE